MPAPVKRCVFGADGTFACAATTGAPRFPSDAPFQPPAPHGRFSCGSGGASAPPPDGALTRARSSGPVGPGNEPFRRPAGEGVPGPFVESGPMPVDMFSDRISGGRPA